MFINAFNSSVHNFFNFKYLFNFSAFQTDSQDYHHCKKNVTISIGAYNPTATASTTKGIHHRNNQGKVCSRVHKMSIWKQRGFFAFCIANYMYILNKAPASKLTFVLIFFLFCKDKYILKEVIAKIAVRIYL